ncbi:MAG: sugar ABC transporter permease [Anaerolineaceae bacterium]|nr:sugar ABC transporter permease [Anaerolineaceae bacterium]
MSKNRTREAIEGYLFLLPNLVGFLIFMAIPLAVSFYYSFTDYNLFTKPNFIGITNYGKVLGFTFDAAAYQAVLQQGGTWLVALKAWLVPNDPTFWVALGNTIIYALGVLAFSLLPAFILAWMLNSRLRGMTIYRALIYIPVVASIVGSALVWFWIFQRESGVLNTVISGTIQGLNQLLFIPLGRPLVDPVIGWLVSPDWALFSLIIMTSWATVGYDMVVFLAALQSIPAHLYEAATVDGAGRWSTLSRITVPLMTPTIFFLLVTNTISALQIFAEPYIMTQGGPANSTLTIVYYLYQKGFQRFQMGYGAALAWIMFALIFVITTIQFRASNRWVYEE